MKKPYIKYSEARYLLRNAVELLGYRLDKLGSSRGHLKYKSETFGDTIIISNSTNYELFFSATSSEKGDVISFLQHRNGSSVNLYADFKKNKDFIDQKLQEASNFTLRTEEQQIVSSSPLHVQFLQETEDYVIQQLPDSPEHLPRLVQSQLAQRGIRPSVLWKADIKDSVGILWLKRGEKKIPNLVFLWKKPKSKQVVGAQYKYYQSNDKVSLKKFVPGSDRTDSLWFTDTTNKTKLFITEDVYDALAHKLIFKNADYAYCATGGSVTKDQVSAIRSIVQEKSMTLVLGNDKDGAGMLANLKILTDLKSYEYNKQNKTLSVTLDSGEQYSFDYSEGTQQMVSIIRGIAEQKGVQLEVPITKDWNEDLKLLSKPSKQLETTQKSLKGKLTQDRKMACTIKL